MNASSLPVLIACFALVVAIVKGADEKTSDQAAAESENGKTFKQPETLAELLTIPPGQLEKVDLARMNLLCAEGLRGSEAPDSSCCSTGRRYSANMSAACGAFDPRWFRDRVRNKGPWDYKQQGKQYQAFGNFNFGATGRAMGFPAGVLLRQAGAAQRAAGTSKPEWGDPGWKGLCGGTPPYGDDPIDQYWIEMGMHYYNYRYPTFPGMDRFFPF